MIMRQPRNHASRLTIGTWRVVSLETGCAWPASSVAVMSEDDGTDVASVITEAVVEVGEEIRLDRHDVSFFLGRVVDLSIKGEVGVEGRLLFTSQGTAMLPPILTSRN